MILRRLYLYLVSAAALVVMEVGIAGLGTTYLLFAFNDPGAEFSRTLLASYAAAAIVGFPVWAIHQWFARRFALRDPAERASAIRHLYIYWACLVFSVAFLFSLMGALTDALLYPLDPNYFKPSGFDETPLVTAQSTWNALVALVVWLLHYRMAAKDRAAVGEHGASATLRRWYMYAALLAGFIAMLLGGSITLRLRWARSLNSNLYADLVLSMPVAALVAGFIVWSFHAWVVRSRHIEDDRKSTLRAVEGFIAVAFSKRSEVLGIERICTGRFLPSRT